MNNDLNDRQLSLLRKRFFDLLKSFFEDEPDAEKMSRWRGTFAALAKEKVSSDLDSAILRLHTLLDDKTLEELQEEYYQLFVNPYVDSHVENTVSYYIDGYNYGPSLARLREFLQKANLEKNDNLSYSEDSLVIMLDALATLIEEEKSDPDTSRHHQDILLGDYLEPFASRFFSALQQNEKADFYEACSSFLCGYLSLEMGLADITENNKQ